MADEQVIVNFTYEHTRKGQRIRQRGTQIKLAVFRYAQTYAVTAIGDDFQGKGSSLKDAVLDYLKQSNLL